MASVDIQRLDETGLRTGPVLQFGIDVPQVADGVSELEPIRRASQEVGSFLVVSLRRDQIAFPAGLFRKVAQPARALMVSTRSHAPNRTKLRPFTINGVGFTGASGCVVTVSDSGYSGSFARSSSAWRPVSPGDRWEVGLVAFGRRSPHGRYNLGLSSTEQREGTLFLAARILMVLSASILLTLGVVHLAYTFWGQNLSPRDPALQVSMSQVSPVITKDTTMWRCWVGFNASHSIGLILFGLVFGFLALAHGHLLFQSPFLLIVGLAVLGSFVVLCRLYFFGGPLLGISISLACYVASIVFSRF